MGHMIGRGGGVIVFSLARRPGILIKLIKYDLGLKDQITN